MSKKWNWTPDVGISVVAAKLSTQHKDINMCQEMYKDVPTNLIKDCFKGKAYPKYLKEYMECIYKLSYEETPKYKNLANLFIQELKDNGMSDDGTGLDWIRGGSGGGLKGQKRKHDPEPEAEYKEMLRVKNRKVI
uniref:Uncharacterized protein n=1 Tax=Amphimedon queenslandica TaxID=400682 RepID=A0A1X7SZG8_AMPQE